MMDKLIKISNQMLNKLQNNFKKMIIQKLN